MLARLLECLLIASTLLAMVLLALRATPAAGLGAALASVSPRLKESSWRAKVLSLALLTVFLGWNLVQVTSRRQYDYPFQKEHYPFTRFAMFTSPYAGNVVTFGRFIGYDSSGQRYEINPDRLFPALSHTGLYTRTTRLVFMLQSPGKESAMARDELSLWDGAFKRAYLQQEGITLTQIDFARVRHSSRIGEGAKMIEETVLWSSVRQSP